MKRMHVHVAVVPAFICSQLVGAGVAVLVAGLPMPPSATPPTPPEALTRMLCGTARGCCPRGNSRWRELRWRRTPQGNVRDQRHKL